MEPRDVARDCSWSNVDVAVDKQTRRGHFQSLVNAGFFDMEWIMLDLTKNEVQQGLENVVLCIQKVPLQGFSSVPATSVLVCFAALR